MYQMLIVRFSVSVLSAVNEVIIGGVEPNTVTLTVLVKGPPGPVASRV